jgi:AraC-like DNA-binding protein
MWHDLGKSWVSSDFTMGLEYYPDRTSDVAALPHSHGGFVFIICLGGRMDVVCSTQRYLLDKGDMVVHNVGEWHQGRYGTEQSPCNLLGLFFETSVLANFLTKTSFPCGSNLQDVRFLGKVQDPKISDLAQDLIEELCNEEFGREVLIRSLVIEVLIYTLRHCLRPTVVKRESQLSRQLPIWEMNRTMDYMDTHDRTSFSLSELCREIGASPSRFTPLFRNSTGLNPHVYFNKILVEKSRRLLQSADRSVKEVAYELGFKDDSHFCKIFRRETGTTPKSYQELSKTRQFLPSILPN